MATTTVIEEVEDQLWNDLITWLKGYDSKSMEDLEKKVKLVHNQAGRGLVARTDLPPSTLLISIPSKALLNKQTLIEYLYSDPSSSSSTTTTNSNTPGKTEERETEQHENIWKRLTATQGLSLHLALQFRRNRLNSPLDNYSSSTTTAYQNGTSTVETNVGGVESEGSKRRRTTGVKKKNSKRRRDEHWPFIASLPQGFETVPLTWSIESMEGKELREKFGLRREEEGEEFEGNDERLRRRRKRMQQLLDNMSEGLKRRCRDVEKRFEADWKIVQKIWQTNPVEDEELKFSEFLLGWLNVNTRCIFYDVGPRFKKEDYLTLCPVIDLINHVPNLETKPTPSNNPSTSSSLGGGGGGLTFSTPSRNSSDPKVERGDELKFSYGGHDDMTLLSEYGFILSSSHREEDGRWIEKKNGNDYNCVEVDKYIEALFESQGKEGELKVGVLKDNGYWGDMTFQSTPPSPSWRVLMSLRLFHLRLPSHTSLALSSEVLVPWYDVVTGSLEQISDLNERKVGETVKGIAKSLEREAKEGRGRCREVEEEWRKEDRGLKEKLRGEDWRDWEKEVEVDWLCLGMVKAVWKVDEEVASEIARGMTKQE